MSKETVYTDSALSDKIKEFLKTFKKDRKYIYVDKIDSMMPNNQTFITVDYIDFVYEPDIVDQFSKNPDRILDAFTRAIKETLQIRFPDYAKSISNDIAVRITNYTGKYTVRQIDSKSTGKFISIKAMLIRMSPIASIPIIAVYVCPDDHPTVLTAKRNFNVGIPIVCNNPSCKHRDFELKQDASTFVDYQILQLQELPNELPAGKLPKTLDIFVSGSLVDSARMGDTVEIAGIVRAELSNIIKLGIPVQTYRHRLYSNNIERLSNENDFGGIITEDDITKITSTIQNIAEDDATELIINSFAPHIRGHRLIKESLILTMIGSDSHTLHDGTKIRGDINIFLVGDPGTAKSEMGKAVYRVAPRAFYTSGRGSSGVGLTAATIKDNITGVYMLEPGITVLADKGVAIIDEFDKMDAKDRSALHEVMEQQTVSIARGGINATLNARASIIAIANPVFGKYDPFKNLTENIPNIPIPLLTRFDMIFVVRDVPDKEKDTKIARHIISAHSNGDSTHNTANSMDIETFSKYLRIAKKKHPKLSVKAEEKIIAYYIKMRNTDEAESGFTITPRQLEGLIRLTISRAKFLLKDTANEYDADRAIHVLDEMFKSSGVDVNTGKVDFGVIQGRSKSEISKMELFQSIMKGLAETYGTGATEKEIVKDMINSEKWDEYSAKEYIKKVLRESMIYESSPGKYNPMS